ncbi:type II secretion system protein N [Pseudomonas sp. Q1-7]|uniref:type II secretion system protein N n=1 Tax=Pseudomonas sp. Q1-7 TaxID=3020843 RepID=UPI002301773C|nr:type II secretion system protein N [Pseudomonas sp. Q1-7]
MKRALPALARLSLQRCLLPAGVAGLCAWLGWLGLDGWRYQQAVAAQVEQAAAAPPKVQQPHTRPDDRSIAELFGAVPPAPVEALQRAVPLTLLASLAESQATASRALIQSPEGSVFYRLGDRLPGGAQLKSVQADHVVIQLGGREHILRFARSQDRLLVPRPAASPDPLAGTTGQGVSPSPAETTP